MSGKLIVGSMHIGHPQDISIRMLEAFKECNIIYTDYLPDNLYETLRFYKIEPNTKDIRVLKSTNTLFADEYQVQEVVDFIKGGQDVLLVSGEGQITITDPGPQFIQACIENNLQYTVYPGPSSHITAFVASGVTNADFVISSNMEYAEKTIEYFKDQDTPLVIPVWEYRLKDVLEVIDQKFKFDGTKNKKVTICCDMTANEEVFITDWADKIAHREDVINIRKYAKIVLVISDFIKI